MKFLILCDLHCDDGESDEWKECGWPEGREAVADALSAALGHSTAGDAIADGTGRSVALALLPVDVPERGQAFNLLAVPDGELQNVIDQLSESNIGDAVRCLESIMEQCTILN